MDSEYLDETLSTLRRMEEELSQPIVGRRGKHAGKHKNHSPLDDSDDSETEAKKSHPKTGGAAKKGASSPAKEPKHFPANVAAIGAVKSETDEAGCTIVSSCESTHYYYKGFAGGVTLAGAHAATKHEADLEGCVLAPVRSYARLVELSEAIPPCTAAYTAAYKDPLTVYREARSCLGNGQIPYNCDFTSLGAALEGLWGESPSMGTFGACSLEEWFGDDFTNGRVWCPALRENWTNFGDEVSAPVLPSDIWRTGDTSYCGEGPIPHAAAAFATDYTTGEPVATLKALNGGEYLPGAVYQPVASVC